MSSELATPARRNTPPGHISPAPSQPRPPAPNEAPLGAGAGPGDTAEETSSGFSVGGSTKSTSGTGITCRLEELLAERAMTMTELSRRTGITMANLSIMKNNKAKAIRMTTIAALCRALRVTPGQLLVLDGDTP